MAIYFFNEGVSIPSGFKKNITKELVRQILTDFSFKAGNINFILANDEYILQINQDYLKHNYYTDIITFPDYEKKVVNGDVFISITRVIENAETFKVSVLHELLRIIVHGSLHLSGLTDSTKNERKNMTNYENHYLNKFFLSNQNEIMP